MLAAFVSGCGGGSSDNGAGAPAAAGAVLRTALAAPGAAASTTAEPGWIFCAFERQTCSFVGTRQVRFGTLTHYVDAERSDKVACTSSVFGDPARGQPKSCWYEEAPRVATRSDGVDCSSEVFGELAAGQPKACSYSVKMVAAVTPGASGENPPIVFNASGSAAPGDVVSVQGENFGSAPRAYLESAPTTPLQIVNRFASNWLALQIPASAKGALIVRIASETGTSAQVKLNAARPLHFDALQLVPGGAFRLIGRNLLLAGSTPWVTINGLAARLDLAHSDEHLLVGTVSPLVRPSTPATVMVDNGNGSGATQLDRSIEIVASGRGDPFGLGVGWAAGFAAFSGRFIDAATDARLQPQVRCDGTQDDSPALQHAIDLIAADGGGVVRLPAGRCRMAGGMALRSKVVVQGAGKTATELVYESDYPVYAAGVDLAGIRDLALTNKGTASEGPLLKESTRVFIQNVQVKLATSRQMYLTGNRHIVVAGSDFVQSGSISDQGPYRLDDSSGLVFEGNSTSWVDGAPAFSRVHDSLIRNNHFTRDAAFQNAGGTVHSMTLDFAHRVAVVGNTFDVANGPVTNKTRNDGETILTEGGGAGRTENLGSVASAGSTTLTDPNNTIAVDPFGTGTIPENYGVAIVGGKGTGQTRRLLAYSAPTLTVDRAWDVVPDATSRYATFVWGLEKALIKGNTLAQNPRGIWLYHTAVRDVDVVGNSISEGGGIYLRAYQNLATKSFMPIYNVLIAQNRIANSSGNWMSYLTSVFVNADAKAFGTANLGIEMRSNDLTANVPNVTSSTEEYANLEGYMNMMRVETYERYEATPLPRLFGTLMTANSCTHCDTAVRIGTGAGGTTILDTRLVDGKTLLEDWATTSSSEKSVGTVIR